MNTITHRNGTVQTVSESKVKWAVTRAMRGGNLYDALTHVKASTLDVEAAERVYRRAFALAARPR